LANVLMLVWPQRSGNGGITCEDYVPKGNRVNWLKKT